MLHKLTAIFVVVIFAAISSAARALIQWTLVDAQFQSRLINVDSIDDAGIHATANAGEHLTFEWANVLELSRSLPLTPSQGIFELYLTTGDRVPGSPISMANEKLQWKSPSLGEVSFPLLRVAAMGRMGKIPATLEDIRKDDLVQLANGDTAHGIVTQITSSSVTLQADGGTPELKFDAIAAILFATPPGTGGAGTSFRLRMVDGTSITVQSVTLNQNKLTAAFDAKTTRDINLDGVAAIEQLDGPVSWLTSRRPAENIYKPFFEEKFPTRFDKTVAEGKPIVEKFPPFRHGIGCHSYSKLVYDLDGKYAAFRTQYKVDSDSPLADVTVRIKLDDKTVFEQKNAKGGKIYPLQLIPLDAAKTLTLEVDYGANYATEGRFVWLDPALVRTLPVATEPTTKP